jgi:hypothetical protein
VVGEVHHEVDALMHEQRARGALDELRAGVAVEHVDLRRARARAHGDLGPAAVPALADAAGRQHREIVERPEQVDLVLDQRLRVIGAHDHRVVLEERVGAARGLHHALDLLVRRRQRRDLGVGPVLVRVGVVVGEREQQEVEQVVLDEMLGDAAGVLVADAR